jgi:hypothetical protein
MLPGPDYGAPDGEGRVLRSRLQHRGAAVLGLLTLGIASAAEAAPPVLLLSHSVSDADDARNYAAYVARGLGPAAPLFGERLARTLSDEHSLDPGRLEWPTNLKARVADARTQFLEGQYVDAIAALEALREEISSVPALVASQAGVRDLAFEVQLHLAYAYLRADQKENAHALVGELLRSFPDREISLARHGPELARFIRSVRQAMQKGTRGALHVSTDPRGCVVFVNERYAGVSPVHLTSLAPGRYRIYTQRGERHGRIHRVEVKAGVDHIVKIDFNLDSVLQTTPFVGLRYPNDAAMRAREARDGAAVGRALGVETVVLLGFRRHQGRKSLQGTVLAAGAGRVVRSAMVVLEPAPAPAALAALGRFLVAGEPAAAEAKIAVIIHEAGAPTEPPPDPVARARRLRILGWSLGGVGVAALAAGIALLAVHGQGVDCPSSPGAECRSTRNTLAPGVVAAGLGAALATTGGILVYRFRAGRAAVAVRTSGAAVALTGEF